MLESAMRHKMYPPIVEPLEKRQVLSGLGCDAAVELLDAIDDARTATLAPLTTGAAPASATALAAPVSTNPFTAELLGTFRGEVKVKKLFFRRELDVELVVTEVTDAGITGKLTVDDHDVEGTFPGVLRPNGRFNYTHREDGARVSLRGKVVPQNDRLVGKLKVKGFGLSAGGSFKLDRVTPAEPAPPQG